MTQAMSFASTLPATTRSCGTASPDQTRDIGRQVGEAAEPGDVILLVGQLGTGKTVFTQGVGEGLGVNEPVNSPTFVLLREYHGRLPLYHYDLYRLGNIEHTVTREWDEFLYGSGISLVEWANLAAELLPSEHLLIEFRIEAEGRRRLDMSATGQRHTDLLRSLGCS
jgi:tRNA threonylcarbamoyladenosine biosynthesis protein TsaE